MALKEPNLNNPRRQPVVAFCHFVAPYKLILFFYQPFFQDGFLIIFVFHLFEKRESVIYGKFHCFSKEIPACEF